MFGTHGRLVETHGCDEKNSLLTDRSFLVKAPRILQAKALLAGRGAVEPEDLRVLAYMTTYRVPPHVHQEMHEIIDGAQRNPSPTSRFCAAS